MLRQVRTSLRFTKTFGARSLATMSSAWPLKNESGSRIVLSFRSPSFSEWPMFHAVERRL